MARYGTHPKALSARGQRLVILYTLTCLLVVAFMGWVWWHFATRISPTLPQPTGNLRSNAAPPGFAFRGALTSAPSPSLLLPGSQSAMVLSGQTQITITYPPTASPRSLPVEPVFSSRPVRDVLETQLALERQGISPGSLDGVFGSQTRAALRTFQQKEHLALTGELDAATRERLVLFDPPWTTDTITAEDLARLHSVGTTWLLKSLQPRLDYENLLEMVAEKFQAHPNLIRRLNPSVNWNKGYPGLVVQVPHVVLPPVRARAALVRIRLGEKILEAFDDQTNLLVHFPCSIAARVEKRPLGLLSVTRVAAYPSYIFDPQVFPESAEGRELGRKLVLPPGPNNPVGTAWISLDRPGYGIHGTPRPEDVGHTESHGCFRLANWNANYLLQLVRVGTPVMVEP